MTDRPLQNHELAPDAVFTQVRYERKPCRTRDGADVPGLYSAWITLDNPDEHNALTTRMIAELVLALRKASVARDVVAVVLTGAGTRAFSSGGNAREYVESYIGRPDEYRQYLRLFADMITAALQCDKPVICRANGLRLGGGQELGMSCDFTVASDIATFGQAGPKRGSAAVAGSTDFLPLFVGVENAMQSAVLCEPWSAYKAHRLGLITDVVPVLCVDGRVVLNPLVVTDRYLDGGRIVYGDFKSGAEAAEARRLFKTGRVDLAPLDARVDELVTSLMLTFPGCTTKTIEALRTHKLAHWDKNREGNRAWLALNMLTEARAGFRAYHEGARDHREVDFVRLRQLLATGSDWNDALVEAVIPKG